MLPQPSWTFVTHHLAVNGFSVLPIELDVLGVLTQLPFHHRDPFDRILIAQAMSNSLALVSVDTVFDFYGVQRVS